MVRVVITGVGVVSPIGLGREAFWDGLTRGVSGIRRISKFDPAPFTSQVAGEIQGFDPVAHLPRRDVVRTDTFIQYALVAAREAVKDAGLDVGGQADRVGVSIGTGMGGIPLLLSTHEILLRDGPKAVSPYALPGFLPNMAAGWVSMRTGARGPLGSPTTACAAGNQAIGDAFRIIQRGDADAMLAGGTESLICPGAFSVFCALRALSTNLDPAQASRPFDKARDGFVLAEGAAIVVLERLERAQARGARIYGEVSGYGVSADAHHPTSPSTDGPVRAMAAAMRDAGIRPDEIDYINAHGTSTVQNDLNETMAIKQVFGAHAGRLAISSTKSMTGHLLGAAGAVEAVATVLAIERGIAPPTINYQTPDPECDLDYVPNKARPMPIRAAMSNAFAFGGVNAVLVFRAAPATN